MHEAKGKKEKERASSSSSSSLPTDRRLLQAWAHIRRPARRRRRKQLRGHGSLRRTNERSIYPLATAFRFGRRRRSNEATRHDRPLPISAAAQKWPVCSHSLSKSACPRRNEARSSVRMHGPFFLSLSRRKIPAERSFEAASPSVRPFARRRPLMDPRFSSPSAKQVGLQKCCYVSKYPQKFERAFRNEEFEEADDNRMKNFLLGTCQKLFVRKGELIDRRRH